MNGSPAGPRALFLVPPTGLYLRQDRCQTFLESSASMEPPNELGYMASQARLTGWECRIEDYPMTAGGWKNVESDIAAYAPKLIVLAVTAPTLEADCRAASSAKGILADCVTAVKAAWMTPEEATALLRNHPELDIVFLSGYEITTATVCRAIKEGRTLAGITGLVVRTVGNISFAGPQPILKDPDELPFPSRDLMRNELYIRPDNRRPQATIQTARGCPYGCSFCLASVVEGDRVLERDPVRIVDEIQECVERYGIRDFFLRADTFTLHKEWVIALCREILNRGLDVEWACNSRTDTIDEERLDWMTRAGCWLVSLGIESGNQEDLDRMHKGTKISDASEAVRLCRKYGVKTYAFYILGFPWDDERSIRRTISFAKGLDADYFLFHILIPFAGTAIYSEVSSGRLLKEQPASGFDHSHAATGTNHLSADQLDRLWRLANWSMYTHPPYLFRLLKGVLSPRYFFNYLRFGFEKLKYLVLHSAGKRKNRHGNN